MKKIVLAVVAAATLGTVALSTSSAFAYWPHYGWRPFHYWGFGWRPYPGPVFYPGAPFAPCHLVLYPWPHKVCRFVPY